MKRRRGKSLIEMVVVMTVMSGMVGLCAMSLHVMLRASGAGAKHLVATTVLARLARQFRNDVHSATAAQLVPGDGNEPPALRLIRPDGRTVEYQATDAVVLRREQQEGTLRRRESFGLPGGENRFVVPDDSRLIGFVHRHRPGRTAGDESAVREFRIDALAGRDHEYVRPRN